MEAIEIPMKECGEMLVPDIKISPTPPLGKYGRRMLRHMKANRMSELTGLRMCWKSAEWLALLNMEAMAKEDRLVEELTKKSPPPDRQTDPVGWARHTQQILLTAEEMVWEDIRGRRTPKEEEIPDYSDWTEEMVLAADAAARRCPQTEEEIAEEKREAEREEAERRRREEEDFPIDIDWILRETD